jgi:hypothetical protein
MSTVDKSAEWWTAKKHQEFVDELLRNAPESWDDDDAAEAVAVSYVRALEERVQQLGGTTERWWSHDKFRLNQQVSIKISAWRWLASTRRLQVEAYHDDVWPKTGDVLADSVTMNSTALLVELGEALQEVGWKSWASPRGWVNRDAYIGELVDVGHFLANLLVAVGCDDAEWETRYVAKQALNLKRQLEGYDGVSTKCPGCHRDRLDVGVVGCYITETGKAFCVHTKQMYDAPESTT